MKNTVVYFGIIKYPDKNAMCQRVHGIRKSCEDLGFHFVQIGVNSEIKRGKSVKVNRNVYEINAPVTITEWADSCIRTNDIIKILSEIGIGKIRTFIMADYRYIPMLAMRNFCKRKKIHFVADIMDWFQTGKGIFEKIKYWDNCLRMKKLYPGVKRRIYISKAFQDKFGVLPTTAFVPGTVDPDDPEWQYESSGRQTDKIVFTFAGDPGKHCEKEKIDWVIRALYELNAKDFVSLNIAGTDEKILRKNNPYINSYINESIHFYGMISHNECIRLVKESDFSLIIRPDTDLSRFGFSTKLSESFVCSTPVFATNTGDISNYVTNGKNGFLCDCSYDSVKNCLSYIMTLKKDDLDKMKIYARDLNKLIYSNFTDALKGVL